MDIEQQAQIARNSGVCQTENFDVSQGRDEYCTECQRVVDMPNNSNLCRKCFERIVEG